MNYSLTPEQIKAEIEKYVYPVRRKGHQELYDYEWKEPVKVQNWRFENKQWVGRRKRDGTGFVVLQHSQGAK